MKVSPGKLAHMAKLSNAKGIIAAQIAGNCLSKKGGSASELRSLWSVGKYFVDMTVLPIATRPVRKLRANFQCGACRNDRLQTRHKSC